MTKVNISGALSYVAKTARALWSETPEHRGGYPAKLSTGKLPKVPKGPAPGAKPVVDR